MKPEAKSKTVSVAVIREYEALRVQLQCLVTQSLSGRRVLWVDDHPENNKFSQKILEDVCEEVRVVSTTGEALAVLREEGRQFHIVVTDMGRGADPIAGLTLMRAIRQNNREVPIILYSNGDEAEHRRKEIQAAGGIGPIVGPEMLFQQLSSVIEGDDTGSRNNR